MKENIMHVAHIVTPWPSKNITLLLNCKIFETRALSIMESWSCVHKCWRKCQIGRELLAFIVDKFKLKSAYWRSSEIQINKVSKIKVFLPCQKILRFIWNKLWASFLKECILFCTQTKEGIFWFDYNCKEVNTAPKIE